MRFHLADGTALDSTYERAACTHGEPRSVAEIEGLRGAVNWDWLMLEPKGTVTHSVAVPNYVERQTTTFTSDVVLGMHDRPLVYFYRCTCGIDSPAVVE